MFYERLGLVKRSHVSIRNEEKDDSKDEAEIKYYSNQYSVNGQVELFQQVIIETQSNCDNNCPFCPQSHTQRQYSRMEWETFTKIIDEFCAIKYSGRVTLFITNEPLLDERIEAMIQYCRQKSSRIFIDLNTNGKILLIDLLDKFIQAGLDNINIELYYPHGEESNLPYIHTIQEIRQSYKNNPKIDIHTRSLEEQLSNRAGNTKKAVTNLPLNWFCNYPFRKIASEQQGMLSYVVWIFYILRKLGISLKPHYMKYGTIQ
ncbi:radical SAM protein [uncultured Methanospirillum sp.]|uniref:radical SAM protein n=1 Tax=uncultured Methanospirillum sp. TaxID=262503 RepID=UPI0029C96FFE|nr:radical SAM protein [uncultured Methanospirillum sp.]